MITACLDLKKLDIWTYQNLSIVMVWTTAKYYIFLAARTCQNLTFERHLYGILSSEIVS